MNIRHGSLLLIESSFGNSKPKCSVLEMFRYPYTFGGQAVSYMFLGQYSLSKKSDCGGIFPCFLFFSPSHSPQRQIMAERSHDAALLEGEIMTSSLVVAAAASTPVLLEVGFGCQDGCPYLKEARSTLGSCKFVDIVKHIGLHQGIDQGASTEGAVRV